MFGERSSSGRLAWWGHLPWMLAAAWLLADVGRSISAAEPEGTKTAARLLILRDEGPALVAVEVTVEGRAPEQARALAVVQGLPREANGALQASSWSDFWAEDRDRWLFTAEEPADSDRETRERLSLIYDRDRDGLVDPNERHAWLASDALLGPALAMAADDSPAGASPGCLAWLDQDHDGRLSDAEQSQAGDRLRACDRNGDEWLDPGEVSARIASDEAGPWSGSHSSERPLALLWLAEVPRSLASAAVDEAYGLDRANHDSLDPAGRELLARLDADQDGRLATAEFAALNVIEPDWLLVVRFDKRGFLFDPRSELLASGWLGRPGGRSSKPRETDAPETVSMAGPPWLRLDVTAPASLSATLTVAHQAFDAADRDRNEYLSDGEIGDFAARWRLAGPRLMAAEGELRWDASLIALLARRHALETSTVRLDISRATDPGWTWLDTSGDGRLSFREQLLATGRLAASDVDGDGTLAPDEIPRPVQLRVVAGQPLPGPGGMLAPPARDGSGSPRWFQASDINRDGDLSPAEFLGTPAQFEEIDRDRDGLIDPAEAASAAP